MVSIRQVAAWALVAVATLCGSGVAHATDYTWTKGSYSDNVPDNDNTNWNNAANWAPNGVPGDGDSANIGLNDTIYVGSDRSLGALNQSSGYLINGTINITGTGTGGSNWSGGAIGCRVNVGANATLNLIGSGNKTLQGYGLFNYGDSSSPGLLINNGAVIWSAGNIVCEYGDSTSPLRGAVINNGLFDVTADGTFSGGGMFSNAGILRKSGGLETSFMNGVPLSNSGTLDVRTGAFSLNSATRLLEGTMILGNGQVRFVSGDSSANGNIGGLGHLEMVGGQLEGVATFGDALNVHWTGGTIGGNLSIGSSAKLDISGPDIKRLTGYGLYNYGNSQSPGILNNAGTATWSSGVIDISYGDTGDGRRGAIFNSGTFNIQTDAGVTGSGTFRNTGTINRNTVAGTTSFAAAVDNNGILNVQTGTMRLAAGGRSSGTFNIADGTTLDFAGGTHVLSTGANFNNAGRSRINEAGTVVFNDAGATVAINSGATIELSEGGTFGNNGTLTGPGVFNWTGGTISGTLTLDTPTTATLTGTKNKLLQGYGLYNYGNSLSAGRFVNLGTTRWQGGAIQFDYGDSTGGTRGAIYNVGTFSIECDSNTTGGGLFGNAGTLRKTMTSGATTFDSAAPLLNVGTLDVQTGSFVLPGNSILNNGTTFSGAGRTRFTAGTNTLSGTTGGAGNLELAGGTLIGVGTVAGTATFHWTGGTISGRTTIGSTATAELSGSGTKSLSGYGLYNYGNADQPGIFTNNGVTKWTGGDINTDYGDTSSSNRGVIKNTGIFNANSTGSITGSGTLQNAGTLNIGAPSGAPASIGTLKFDAGSTFKQTTTGTLNIDIASPTSYDRLLAPGAVTFGGKLNVSYVGSYRPVAGSKFVVIDFGTRTGTFASVLGGLTAQINETGATTNLTLTSDGSTPGSANTLKGRVFDTNGTTGLNGVRVFLVKNNNLAALLAEGSSPDLLSVATAGTTATTTGSYTFSNVPAGTYRIYAVRQGTAFNPVVWTVTVPLSNAAQVFNFRSTGPDTGAPTVTITTPENKNYQNAAALPAASGTGSDPVVSGQTTSGLSAVAVALYQLQSTSTLPPAQRAATGIYNWVTKRFVAPTTQGGAILKIATRSGSSWIIPANEFPDLPTGTYRLSALGIDGAFNVGPADARNFTVGAAAGGDVTPPTTRITYPVANATLPELEKIEATATDNVGGTGVERVDVFLFRNLQSRSIVSVGADVREYSAQFWNGAVWVNYAYRTAGTYSRPTATLPVGLPTTYDTARRVWVARSKLPSTLENGTYYVSAIGYDGVGNHPDGASLLVANQTSTRGGFISFKINRPTTVTVTGRITSATNTGVPNVPVYLVRNGNFSALITTGGPDVTRTVTNASGFYTFTNVVQDTYLVTPLRQGTVFGGAIAPSISFVTGPITTNITRNTTINFKASGSDAVGPVVEIKSPVHGSRQASLPAASGTITDATSGPLAVAVALYRLESGRPTGVFDWTKREFIAANSNIPGVFNSIRTSGPGWSLTLPALAPGTYRLSAIGIDKAFRVGAADNNDFTIGSTSTVDKIAPLSSILKVNTTTVANLPVPTVAAQVSTLGSISGAASDIGGTGVAKVNLYLFRNLQTVISGVAYSAEFWTGAAWSRQNLNPLSSLASLPALATTLTPAAGGTSVTWARTSGLPSGSNLPNDTYYVGSLATDKAGNVTPLFNLVLTGRAIKVTASSATRSASVATGALGVSLAYASAAKSSIVLTFAEPLNSEDASDAGSFFAAVNDQQVEIEAVSYSGNTVTLVLPDGSLQTGDNVDVQWSSLRDRNNTVRSGGTTVAAR